MKLTITFQTDEDPSSPVALSISVPGQDSMILLPGKTMSFDSGQVAICPVFEDGDQQEK